MKFIIGLLCLFASVLAGWETYPAVPKTASINGFADPIKALLPVCATNCVDYTTSNTPCPYWDTGCLCVMPQWSGLVGQCIADSCSGTDVAKATSLALSLCSSVGANVWMMPASISTGLSEAAAVTIAQTAAESGTSTASTDSLTSVEASGASNSASSSPTTSSATGSSTLSNAALQKSTSVFAVLLVALGFLMS